MLPAGVLGLVPGCERGRAPHELLALAGGPANRTYRVRTDRGTFVVRLHEPTSGLLGVDRVREQVLHGAAARAGLAPPLVAADPDGEFLITEYVPGRHWEAADMADASQLTTLARRLRALHALPPPPVAAFDPALLLAVHVQRIGAADPAAAAELEPLLGRAAAVLRHCRAGDRSPCIVHNDLHHTNLLAGERLWLLDFEYAAVTDPLFDLACLTAYYPQAARHAPLIIEESGLGARVSVELLAEAAWLYVLLSYLWYRALRLAAPPGGADAASERALAERLQRA